MSRSRILKRQAIDIAKKFKADINPDGPHEIASVYHEGALVLTFGINHGKKAVWRIKNERNQDYGARLVFNEY